ncbi:conserved hypothetical protein [Candidatus Zixiibacteriota bacterium]|nr:conserved hypothetical protein [candidate division Zixibacteria bacterium]
MFCKIGEDAMKKITGEMALGLLVLFLIAGGCSSGNSLAPFQPEVNNVADNFQMQATAVKNTSTTLNYNWSNSGTTANVNQATTFTAGTATLTIFDSQNNQVFTHNLNDNGTFTTSIGAAGIWRIVVQLNNYSGTLNFRVQKP